MLDGCIHYCLKLSLPPSARIICSKISWQLWVCGEKKDDLCKWHNSLWIQDRCMVMPNHGLSFISVGRSRIFPKTINVKMPIWNLLTVLIIYEMHQYYSACTLSVIEIFIDNQMTTWNIRNWQYWSWWPLLNNQGIQGAALIYIVYIFLEWNEFCLAF